MRLATADRAEAATALGLSDPECQGARLRLSDTYPADAT
jgi:hypothetical protein